MIVHNSVCNEESRSHQQTSYLQSKKRIDRAKVKIDRDRLQDCGVAKNVTEIKGDLSCFNLKALRVS